MRYAFPNAVDFETSSEVMSSSCGPVQINDDITRNNVSLWLSHRIHAANN